MNTCDKCINYQRESLQDYYKEYKDQGYCALFGDSSNGTPNNTVCYGEGDYVAGVLVMAKFGCIHFKEKV